MKRIRSNIIFKTGDKTQKVKKLQLKYERYDHINEVFKNVRVKDGGGPRFIDVICNQPITFREIRVKGEELYFDVNNCNKFNEKNTDCLIHIYNVADESLDENENLWKHIPRKCIFLSKSAFTIKSKLLFTDALFEETIEVGGGNVNNMLMDTNFASAFSISQINAGTKLPVFQPPAVRAICQTRPCTYIGETCIYCEQNQISKRGLRQDVALSNQQTLSETVSETQISNEHEVLNTD